MSTKIKGTKFIYDIDDTDYLDGFIAKGTESFVFKAKKISIDDAGKSDLSFSCVLKFRPLIGDKLERFKSQEFKIFEELQECRSVARIYDVVEDIGDDFELRIPGTEIFIRNKDYNNSDNILPCFCVVEEFIDGWSLEQYCRREFWGLEKEKKHKWIRFDEFSEVEKEEVYQKYKDEKTFFRYQDKLLHFMQSLCGILTFISTTSRKKVLHLDIKPENIMVTRQSEELVLIDFGRSIFLPEVDTLVDYDIPDVNYNNPEEINALYSHGTIGFAAPECFAVAKDSEFPFSQDGYQIGKMSIESDIFSFGATFWECMNIMELTTQNKLFSRNPHDFYEKYLLNDKAYFNRDLSLECTGPLGGRYHYLLQQIIIKCTRKRKAGYLTSKDYYHNYEELRKDIDEARESIPIVKKNENKQVKNAAITFGICIGCVITLFVFLVIYRMVGYQIATRNWNTIVADIEDNGKTNSAYQATQYGKLSEVAVERMQLGDSGQKRDVCKETFNYLTNDNDISAIETSIFASVLNEIDDNELKREYIDKIIEKANSVELSSICSTINSLGLSEGNVAIDLAIAIYSVENTNNYDYVEAYNLLVANSSDARYKNAVKHLAVSLNNKGDIVINSISSKTGKKRSEIKDVLSQIEKN